ncbi:lysophospholipase [Aulographum hederae CBS 113979]|uniref:Lysophospholipase n=1 Tax=Aulographum hederae CBS 113979 TaxID=1176131 RepID=A0A6G1H6V8_9PEZI|nr:lysophospholipase [Aulographum hederae CBS 113979]
MFRSSFIFVAVFLLLASSISAAPTERQLQLSPYAPRKATCPSTPLVRPATGLSSSETTYVKGRKTKANAGLAAWLKKVNSGFATTKLPTVSLATSGGGYRALLTGGGIVQAFDARDSTAGTAGLYQGLTYHAGLSGGAWLLSSIVGNNYPTITSLKKGLWEAAFQASLLLPGNLLAADAYVDVVTDITAKDLAGFDPTLTDPWGRLLSYQLLYGPDGGVTKTLSSVSGMSNFTSFNGPFPIMTALGINTFEGKCLPDLNATQYEFTPYDFGSWDKGVSAFTQTKYLGTTLTNGKPSSSSNCIQNYDNLGYVLGTSSHLFNSVCGIIPPINSTNDLAETLEAIIDLVEEPALRDLYAVYKNPFKNYTRSSLISAQSELDLVDGGEANQINPIWPFIQPSSKSRADVLIVNDNAADTDANFPDGSELQETYIQAQAAGLTRMPFIPSAAVFAAKNLTKRASFFGCGDASKLTIVYLPNTNYTYPSGQPTLKLQYSVAETDGMVANGVAVGTQNGDANWPTCLGCAILQKSGTTLPTACTACFSKYCYKQ